MSVFAIYETLNAHHSDLHRWPIKTFYEIRFMMDERIKGRAVFPQHLQAGA